MTVYTTTTGDLSASGASQPDDGERSRKENRKGWRRGWVARRGVLEAQREWCAQTVARLQQQAQAAGGQQARQRSQEGWAGGRYGTVGWWHREVRERGGRERRRKKG
jgi:hypothetical protein